MDSDSEKDNDNKYQIYKIIRVPDNMNYFV